MDKQRETRLMRVGIDNNPGAWEDRIPAGGE
jgi:hypothetical protein